MGIADLPTSASNEWRWSAANVLLAAGGLVGTVGVVLATYVLPRFGLLGVVLLAAGAGGLGLMALANQRFEHYLVVLFVTRTTLDYLKPSQGGGLLEPTSAVGGLSLVLGLAWLWQRRRRGRLVQTSRLTLALVGMSAIAFINPLFAVGRLQSFESSIRFSSFTVMFAVLEQLFRTNPTLRRRLLRAVLWSLVAPAAMAAIQLTTSSGNAEFLQVGRVQGTFAHPNPFGTYLAMIVVIALVMAVTAPRLTQPVLYGGALIAATTLIFTYSRGAWIAAIVGAAIVGWRLDRRILRVMLVGGILVLVAVPSVATRLADLDDTDRVSATADPNSLAWRVGYWEDIVPLGLDSPVGGIGLEGTQLVRTEGLAPHNVFIQAFVELGFPGLLALLIALVAGVNEVHRSDYWARDDWERGLSAGAAAVGLGFLLQMFSENLLTQAVSLWYFAVVLAAALANGWTDGVSPTTILGELSLRQRLSLFIEQRRRPEGHTIRDLEGTDIGSRIKDILERNSGRSEHGPS